MIGVLEECKRWCWNRKTVPDCPQAGTLAKKKKNTKQNILRQTNTNATPTHARSVGVKAHEAVLRQLLYYIWKRVAHLLATKETCLLLRPPPFGTSFVASSWIHPTAALFAPSVAFSILDVRFNMDSHVSPTAHMPTCLRKKQETHLQTRVRRQALQKWELTTNTCLRAVWLPAFHLRPIGACHMAPFTTFLTKPK